MMASIFNPTSTVLKASLGKLFLLILLLLLPLANTPVYGQITLDPVSPLQTGHYMSGLIGIRDYTNPAPASGLIFLDYNIYQFGNKFMGPDGNQITQINGPLGDDVDLNLDVDGYFNSPMLIWAAKKKVLGATYYGGISVPVITVNSNLAYARIGDINDHHESGDASGKVSGLSDVNVMPVYLSWSKTNLDITAGYMFFAPTGQFELGGDDNTGLGYWSHVFQAYGYWYPEKDKGAASKALALMVGASYELIGEIKDSDVRPGNRFSLDYGIDQYFTDQLSIGLFGGNNWQVSEDKGSQVYWDKSIKDKLGVAGIQVGYWLWANRLQAVAKYGFNYGGVDRFQQNLAQINLVFMTNALTGNKKPKTISTK